jgi:hypothetical protein
VRSPLTGEEKMEVEDVRQSSNRKVFRDQSNRNNFEEEKIAHGEIN